MYFVYDITSDAVPTKGTWYYLLYGDNPDIRVTDFKMNVEIYRWDLSPYWVSASTLPWGYRGQEVGDINGFTKVNIVNAQICYDIAKGGVYTNALQIDMRHVLMCDVSVDGYIDAVDAFETQYAAVHGGFPVG